MKKVKFTIIAAVSINGIIGIDNEIPWRIPEDFKHFRDTTMGNTVLVGYNTFKTLPQKAFEGRKYIVVTGDNSIENNSSNIIMVKDIKAVFDLVNDEKSDIDEVFVAGGAMIYHTMINYCDKAIITWVNIDIPDGNKLFPIDAIQNHFNLIDKSVWMQSKSGYEFKINTYVKA